MTTGSQSVSCTPCRTGPRVVTLNASSSRYAVLRSTADGSPSSFCITSIIGDSPLLQRLRLCQPALLRVNHHCGSVNLRKRGLSPFPAVSPALQQFLHCSDVVEASPRRCLYTARASLNCAYTWSFSFCERQPGHASASCCSLSIHFRQYSAAARLRTGFAPTVIHTGLVNACANVVSSGYRSSGFPSARK